MRVKKISIKDAEGNLLAEDSGEFVTLESLKEKLEKKGTIFLDSMEVIETDIVDEEVRVNLYNAMVKDIYDEMEKVFGTRNDASAMAFAATWEAMSKRPSSYVDPELGFDSEEEVTTYANLKIAESDAYGVFRLKRLNQFTQNV